MIRPLISALVVSLLVASSAHAQYGGGGGGGSGGHGHGGHGGSGAPSSSDSTAAPPPAKTPDKPVDQVDIIGVVQAIDSGAGRVTIAYEPVEALGWPKGSMPFVVSQPDLLKSVAVGERVRFRLESQQIYQLNPF
jgi:Cu/Ag efflux protein CusF